MPQPRTDIRMIKDILRLKLESKLSHNDIAVALGISKGLASKYISLAAQEGLLWAQIEPLDEVQLEHKLLGRDPSKLKVVEPDFGLIHIELRRKGVTLALLWQEYRQAFEGQRTWAYTQFCEHYKMFAKTLKRSMRQHRRAGEKMFIDFAGPTLALVSGARAHVFVCAMGASSYTFACATPDETMRSWLTSMARALTFYGGVPELIIPDNPKSLVSNACRFEPELNASVRDFARYYSVGVLPARPYSPKDKATAESAVQVVERWIMARLRNERFSDVNAVDRAIATLLPLLNTRPFQKLQGSRASQFASLDAPELKALPAQMWAWATFKKVRVHINYHIEVQGHYYSVPNALVGLEMEARITDALIEVLHKGKRVACHPRSHKKGDYSTIDEHMSAAHRAHKEWTAQRLIHWSGEIGSNTQIFVTQLLGRYKHPEHGYRSCLGLISLTKRYGNSRVDSACKLALALGAVYYRHVKEILINGRDLVVVEDVQVDWVSPEHDNVRGAASYH